MDVVIRKGKPVLVVCTVTAQCSLWAPWSLITRPYLLLVPVHLRHSVRA